MGIIKKRAFSEPLKPCIKREELEQEKLKNLLGIKHADRTGNILKLNQELAKFQHVSNRLLDCERCRDHKYCQNNGV